ncbi:glycosyl hydrolase family 18 protein [Nitzschia inconspicua]|uniref:Glycosyl hydrolase family 18 protein n=1 Tax=Nitzschia inconspicua TaxID=303405 RepID=A0A9K3LBJ5_9STRA|nr:glycosyl hydrolase family 18 protein [Nitzschia inconspicua]
MRRRQQQQQQKRPLPDRLLISYTTQCSPKVVQAVENGVNVVIWAFCEMIAVPSHHDNDTDESGNRRNTAQCISRFDRDCAKEMIANLDTAGFQDTVHLVSFGGWNGPHLPDELTAEDMYRAWKYHCGDIFHGIDWDLEGHDRLDSPTNVFSTRCLENMGRFSELAKQDGYIIGMAPPQSYLDVDTPHFSRKVNLIDNTRDWHEDFHYFGANVYAYLLAKYGTYIDFVSIQFYESFSRAGMKVYHEHTSQENYLYDYVYNLVTEQSGSFFVDFEQDPMLQYPSGKVKFPLSKLVLGFANGWAPAAGANFIDDTNDKVCYFDPIQIERAYKRLSDINVSPRGFMYWVMDEDGNKGIDFSKSLNRILDTRRVENCDARDRYSLSQESS